LVEASRLFLEGIFMNRLKTTRFALSVLLAGTALAAVVPAQAQPMMGGERGMYQDNGYMYEQMSKHMERRQADLKIKLHLAAGQEAAWNAFVQGMKPPAKPTTQYMDRDELAKLTTPERLDKIKAIHEANFKAIEAHMKQHSDATQEFYSHLSAEQQKVFDAETLPERWKGRRN
jgi:periplasmic protein CpxP/Spy